jgi:hypothetical protein
MEKLRCLLDGQSGNTLLGPFSNMGVPNYGDGFKMLKALFRIFTQL